MSGGMSFELTEDQELIRKSVRELAARFDDQYWMEKDQAHEFPQEFYDAVAGGGWLGMTIPEEYGGHGLGITEATILAEEVAAPGGGMNAASAIHMSIFGMQPVVVYGSGEMRPKRRPASSTGTCMSASVSPNRRRAWTPRASPPSPAATATTMWSTAERCGSPRPWSPRRSCC